MDPREGTEREVAQLAGPRMPADRGLASLGLVMQLVGSVFLGAMAMLALLPIFAGFAEGSFFAFLVGAAGAVRSAFHRNAGSALTYGSPQGVFRSTYTYIGVSVAQTAFTLLILNKDGAVPGPLNLTVAMTLLAWPLTLLALLTRPRLRDLATEEVLPASEDMGFEGSAVLMVVLGIIGALVAALFLYTGLTEGGALVSATGMLLVAVFAMLLARSILHTMAGLRGVRGIDSDGASESASRYYSFGLVTSVITGGALLILVMKDGGTHPVALLFVVGVVYLLLTWPLILRRFYTERNFSALLSGADAPNQRRAPDAGMTALGWLLLAVGVFDLASSLPAALSAHAGLDRVMFWLARFGDSGALDTAGAARSPWWPVGIAMTAVWAGLELVHMTDRHRVAATIYGVVGSVATLYVCWPQLDGLAHAGRIIGFEQALGSIFGFVLLALGLVLPVATALLANRKLLPTAQARIRVSPPSAE